MTRALLLALALSPPPRPAPYVFRALGPAGVRARVALLVDGAGADEAADVALPWASPPLALPAGARARFGVAHADATRDDALRCEVVRGDVVVAAAAWTCDLPEEP